MGYASTRSGATRRGDQSAPELPVTLAQQGNPDQALSRKRLAAFATLSVPMTAAGLPIALHVPAIYAQHFGMSLASIGLIFMLGRFFDAFTDPLIGALSDRTRSRFGRRKPWIAAGSLLFAAAVIALFFPGGTVSPLVFGTALFVLYLGWTMVQIPYLAWSGEVSVRYHERTRVAAYIQFASSVALLLVLVLPAVVDQFDPANGPLKLAIMGAVVLLTLVPAVALVLGRIPEPPTPPAAPRLAFGKALRLVAADRTLRRVLASDFAVTLAQTTRSMLFLFFVSSYLGMPHLASGLYLLQFVFGVFAGPIWLRIALRVGKHRAALLGETGQVLVNAALLLATPGDLPLVVALVVAQGLLQGSGNLMLRALVADVADKNRLETGVDNSGLFFSVFSLAGKSATAVAAGVALPLVSWLGFDPHGDNTPQALDGLLLVFALGPALGHALSALLIRGFPLDERAHADVRRRLEQKFPTSAALVADRA